MRYIYYIISNIRPLLHNTHCYEPLDVLHNDIHLPS